MLSASQQLAICDTPTSLTVKYRQPFEHRSSVLGSVGVCRMYDIYTKNGDKELYFLHADWNGRGLNAATQREIICIVYTSDGCRHRRRRGRGRGGIV